MELTLNTQINSPQSIRNGLGAWTGILGEAIHYDADRVDLIEQRLVERGVVTRDEDEDGNILIDGEMDWWAGAHVELWTLDDVRYLLDDPNAEIMEG